MKSNFLELNKEDFLKIGKGALIAIIGALLTYLSQVVSGLDFGQWTPIVMAFWSIVTNAVKKWLSNNEGQFGKKDI